MHVGAMDGREVGQARVEVDLRAFRAAVSTGREYLWTVRQPEKHVALRRETGSASPQSHDVLSALQIREEALGASIELVRVTVVADDVSLAQRTVDDRVSPSRIASTPGSFLDVSSQNEERCLDPGGGQHVEEIHRGWTGTVVERERKSDSLRGPRSWDFSHDRILGQGALIVARGAARERYVNS
jgi:hypothetical protein